MSVFYNIIIHSKNLLPNTQWKSDVLDFLWSKINFVICFYRFDVYDVTWIVLVLLSVVCRGRLGGLQNSSNPPKIYIFHLYPRNSHFDPQEKNV